MTKVSALREVGIVAGGFVVGSIILAVAASGWGALPAVEGWLWKIVSIKVPPKQVWRDGQRTCFVLEERKLSDATPLTYEFQARSRLSAFVPVPVQLVDPQRKPLPADGLEKHKVGVAWDRGYCFDSSAFPAEDRLTVKGVATHDRHPFYTTVTTIPPFGVPPVSSAAK